MLVIFDWDGTLADSAAKIVRCLRQASAEVSLPILTDDAYRQIIGLGLPEAIYQLYPEISDAQREQLRQQYAAIFVADAEPVCFFDGVLAALPHLKAKGYLLAVATGKSRRGLDRVVGEANLQGVFDVTRCADETASKPKPVMLQEILEDTATMPAAAVMVGDTTFDLDMAANAGVASIAVNYGAHTVEQLKTCAPWSITNDFSEVLAQIDRFFTEYG